jgi:hypothetical protein
MRLRCRTVLHHTAEATKPIRAGVRRAHRVKVPAAARRIQNTSTTAKTSLAAFSQRLSANAPGRRQVMALGLPAAEVMGPIGFVALAANLTSVLLSLRYRDGDANVRSVWLCRRNDAVGNLAVVLAAGGVWATATAGPI